MAMPGYEYWIKWATLTPNDEARWHSLRRAFGEPPEIFWGVAPKSAREARVAVLRHQESLRAIRAARVEREREWLEGGVRVSSPWHREPLPFGWHLDEVWTFS